MDSWREKDGMAFRLSLPKHQFHNCMTYYYKGAHYMGYRVTVHSPIISIARSQLSVLKETEVSQILGCMCGSVCVCTCVCGGGVNQENVYCH